MTTDHPRDFMLMDNSKEAYLDGHYVHVRWFLIKFFDWPQSCLWWIIWPQWLNIVVSSLVGKKCMFEPHWNKSVRTLIAWVLATHHLLMHIFLTVMIVPAVLEYLTSSTVEWFWKLKHWLFVGHYCTLLETVHSSQNDHYQITWLTGLFI